MSWSFEALTAPPASPTPTTEVRYTAQDLPFAGQVRIKGSGFTYDGTTGLLNGGSITSLELWNTAGPGTLIQTLTLGTPITGTQFFAFFGTAKSIGATLQAWNLPFGDDEGSATFTDTLIEFTLTNGTKLRIAGSGFGTSNLGAATGTVTSIQHVDAGNVQVGDHFIGSINQPLALVSAAFGNGEDSYHFFTSGSNTVTLNDPLQTFPQLDGGLGDDTLDGGSSINAFVDMYQATSGIVVTLTPTGGTATGGAGNDTLINIRHINGTDYNDTLTGNDFGNQLFGDAGDDVLSGSGGADTLVGEDGNDTISGGAGSDNIQGSGGNDRIDAGGSDPFAPPASAIRSTAAAAATPSSIRARVATRRSTTSACAFSAASSAAPARCRPSRPTRTGSPRRSSPVISDACSCSSMCSASTTTAR